ncbi:MAG TPA: bacillithiol biosynthesis cysteine-adding enzyme BshC [Puia sp.]|nr:bacillithiol biosynthesis cysteine-adding enzyme BshC [Puia sp.]
MDWTPHHLPYQQTGYFSKIITDYLDGVSALAPFYEHPVTMEGLKASLDARKKVPVDRKTLVTALEDQYQAVDPSPKVVSNIRRLLEENTFTIVTAHQPAIFTGPLYFIYKILHVIKLADRLNREWPDKHFVPVFYMGSEDADLEELGNIYLNGEKLVWDTKQTGAVGRMNTKGLDQLLHRIEGELSVQPHGVGLMEKVREFYLKSPDIQTATFRLLHWLFASYGLVVLIPDMASLKRLMIPVFEDDLFGQIPCRIVEGTIDRLSERYKAQANPRPINLFYLKGDLRGRIEKTGDVYKVHESNLSFTPEEIKKELYEHPERFSPNVILRGLFQETILPNIAFIGGGGETAYWLELKDLFHHYKRPFPLLVLRNSFLLINPLWAERISNAGLQVTGLFQPEEALMNELVRKESQQQLSMEKEIVEAERYYGSLKERARPVDPTLVQHVEALQAKALHPLKELEKKLLKAEKRKFGDRQRQIRTLRSALFPRNGLQERTENFMSWWASNGPAFIADIYRYSPTLEQEFVILTEGHK